MNPGQTETEEVVRTICNSHCGGLCEMKVHVKGGRIIRIENNDDDDGARPRGCPRGRAYRQRIYAPDRLLYPQKRTGKRGSGEFERISWDEALDTVAGEMKRIKDAYGNAAFLHFCSMADSHNLHHVGAFHKLLCQFGGYTAPWGTISNEGLNFSAGTTYGSRSSVAAHATDDYLNAKLIILWSFNPVTTNMGSNLSYDLARAKERGAEFICVDPRYTDSAATYDARWVPIRPCTDAAVFAAMAYVIISENLHDQKFIDAYTVGFDKYKDYVFGKEDGVKKTPGWAEAISGVPAETIADLARGFATTKPAILASNYAAGRTAFGEQFHRAASTMEAITGNATIRSGQPISKELMRIPHIPSPPNQVESGSPQRWNALPYRGPSVNSSARVNVNLFSDALLNGKAGGYPADYKFLWLSNTNYLNQLAEVNKAAKAFQKPEFVLVTEQFMTATARFADIVLPVCTFFERNDIYAPRGGGAYGVVNKIVEPLGESKSQLDICSAIAEKLGIDDYNDKTDLEWVQSFLSKLSEAAGVPEYDDLKTQGIHRLKPQKTPVPLGKENDASERAQLRTPSGKIELYSEIAAKMNHPLIPPIAEYIETWESINDPLAEKYPLQLTTPHFRRRAHSQFDNLPWLRDMQTQVVSINTLDAAPRGIKEGDMVRVFNDRGEMMIPARVTERIMPGVVAVPQGAWYAPDENGVDRGGCANVLTKNVTSPAGAFSPNTALVQVEKKEG
ncbi:molybdopterin-dependent oxidoreductase [Thermodesulfobacteriota bacterium]